MGTYDNRLNGSSGVCRPCSANKPQVQPKPVEPEKKKEAPCCKDFKVASITRVKDEVVIMFDDCTFLKAPLDVVSDALKEGSQEETAMKVKALEDAVKELSDKQQALTDNIIEVQDFSGNTRFKALNGSFNG